MVSSWANSGDLASILRYWCYVCFAVGLPLRTPKSLCLAKLFTLTILLCHTTVSLVYLFHGIVSILRNDSGLYVLKLSNFLNCICWFTMTCILHVALVWKINTLRDMATELNEVVILQAKTAKLVKTFTVLTLMLAVLNELAIFFPATMLPQTKLYSGRLWNTVIRILPCLSYPYPTVFGYVTAFTLFVLGGQFSLLQNQMSQECPKKSIAWERISQRYVLLCEISGKLQKCISSLLAIYLSSSLMCACFNSFYLISNLTVGRSGPRIYLLSFLLSEHCTKCIFLCVAGDYLREQAHAVATQFVIADLKHFDRENNADTMQRLARNARNLEDLTTFSVGGFCHLGRSLLLTMLATLLTYCVLLYQLSVPEPGRFLNSTQT